MAVWKTRNARDGRRGRNPSSPAELLMTRDGGPPELRTAVSIGLNSPFPILVMWGPEIAGQAIAASLLGK